MDSIKLNFRADTAGAFRARLAKSVKQPVLVEVGLTLPVGYLEKYCRYARFKETNALPTFLNTEYAIEPPGTRVGPWPGWRGIPELPAVFLEAGQDQVKGNYYFRGDEEATGELRITFACETGLPRSVSLSIPDPALRPMRAQVVFNLPALAPAQPVALRAELLGVHPRLVISAKEVQTLRQEIRGGRAAHWRRLRKLVRDSWGLPYQTSPEGKVLLGPERLTGMDRTLIASCIALLQPTARNSAWARQTFLAFLKETARADFEPLGIDTQSGEVLYVLCVSYDWLHKSLSPSERLRARKRLAEIAEVCRRHLDPDRRDYAQAHYLGCGMGLLAYAFLFWETEPRSADWAAELRGAFKRVLSMLPVDGFYPHGINLWSYEHGFLLRWLELFRQCTGEDLWTGTKYFANASRFRAAATSPDAQMGVTFGDPQYRVTGDSWCHLLMGKRTQSAVAQELGESLLLQHPQGTDHRHAPPRRRVYELLWHDLKLTGHPSKNAAERFADGGQVFVRRKDTLITLRSGAPLGRQRRAAGEVGGYGHSDPCHGAVLVYRGGTFVGSGPGPLYRRDTGLHNLVTIGDRGQIGDSCVWYPDFLEEAFIPPNPKVRQRAGSVHLSCELASAYLPHLGVIRHTRSLVIAPDGSLRGTDEVELSAADAITWHWHTRAKVRLSKKAFLLTGPGCRARLEFEPEADMQMRTQPEHFVPAYPNEGTVGTEIMATRVGTSAVFRWRLIFD